MDRWLERIPGLASGPLWRRALAATGYAAAAIIAYTAISGPNAIPGPTPEESAQPAVESNAAPVAPDVPPPSIVGTWRGQTLAEGLGVVTLETIFTGNGTYSQLSVSQYPGGTPIRVTGDYTIVPEQNVIQLTHVKTDPRFPIDNILLQYTWLGPNTLRLQDLGCLNYAPQQCGPITYARAY